MSSSDENSGRTLLLSWKTDSLDIQSQITGFNRGFDILSFVKIDDLIGNILEFSTEGAGFKLSLIDVRFEDVLDSSHKSKEGLVISTVNGDRFFFMYDPERAKA